MDEITFMAHVISRHGIELTEERVKAVKIAPRPTTALQTRSFLALFNYNARFVPTFASISEPLRQLTKNGVVLTEKHQNSFRTLKEALTAAKALVKFPFRCRESTSNG